MMIKKQKYAVIVAILFLSFSAASERSNDGIWTYLGSHEDAIIPGLASPDELPQSYGAFSFDRTLFTDLVERFKNSPGSLTDNHIFIPNPEGNYIEFIFLEAPVLHPDLAATNPEILTFEGVQVDDPSVTIRYDITPAGFHAQVLSENSLFYVSPITDNIYLSFFADRHSLSFDFGCRAINTAGDENHVSNHEAQPLIHYGTTLRTYRVAVAATGEYTAAVGGTKALALASITTAINFLNGIYQLEVGVALQIIPTNLNIIYTDASTDPYTPSSGNTTLLTQNQTTVNAVIGAANYDIGHLFHALPGTGNSGSGVASLRSVCRATSKARGVSTASRIGLVPINPFFYRIMLHEIGHQFGANPSFNASCNNNRNSATAYEPGSGTTIMSYAAGCSPYNITTLADTYFHRISLEEISTFLVEGGSLCGTVTNTLNSIPSVEAGVSYTIPKSTPFVLTATGNDVNGNTLTYAWEQFNNEISPVIPPVPTNPVGPNFRSFPPTISPSRYFPRLADIRANISPVWEVLPSVTRTMDFSVVVRDNVGGASSDNMQVTFNAASGPFVVLSPNGGETRIGAAAVTWNRANTHLAPVSTAFVDILLSIDNGQTFPILLADNTPNDGSQTVSFPPIITDTARIQIKAEGNIFFDISNAPFRIRP